MHHLPSSYELVTVCVLPEACLFYVTSSLHHCKDLTVIASKHDMQAQCRALLLFEISIGHIAETVDIHLAHAACSRVE